ncbi:uncharacterized protein LOC141779025 isoform X1 [Sebastes fasciatus]|uniref:uncharacterized protein LOC141779025 isoform X1 n=1 Tax=Sebastes fasciatus TaxID=394691 RepID=UPI003D9F8318
MKLAVALVCLSVAVMVVMVLQAVRQELDLHWLKTRMLDNSAEVKRKEETIVQTKVKINEMKSTLLSVNSKIEEMKKKRTDSEKSAQDLSQSLQTCNTEKAADNKKKTDIGESMTKLKANHEVAKKVAEHDIQDLKQQILDRDKTLCGYADTTKKEARELCGITEATK